VCKQQLLLWLLLVINYRKRFDFASYVRCLADDVWEDVDADEDEEQAAEDGELMDVEKVQLRKPGRNFRNQVIIRAHELWHCVYISMTLNCLLMLVRRLAHLAAKMFVFLGHIGAGSALLYCIVIQNNI